MSATPSWLLSSWIAAGIPIWGAFVICVAVATTANDPPTMKATTIDTKNTNPI